MRRGKKLSDLEKAKKFLNMMIKEVPRTLGNFNVQLLHDDLNKLKTLLDKSGGESE